MTKSNILPQTPQTYDVTCAWCGVVVRQSPIDHSHGICPACYDEQIRELEQAGTWITLSNGQQVNVPPGADPDYVRKIEERKLRNATPKKRKTTKHSSSGQRAGRNWTASSVLVQAGDRGRAMAELTQRTNRTEAGND